MTVRKEKRNKKTDKNNIRRGDHQKRNLNFIQILNKEDGPTKT